MSLKGKRVLQNLVPKTARALREAVEKAGFKPIKLVGRAALPPQSRSHECRVSPLVHIHLPRITENPSEKSQPDDLNGLIFIAYFPGAGG